MSENLASSVLCWIEQQRFPFALKQKPRTIEPVKPKQEPRTIEPVKPKQEPILKKEDLHLFAESHFKMVQPLTPILCLDLHPFLKKVCDALTQTIATTSLITLEEIETRGWDTLFADPFFRYLLVPVEEILAIPYLRSRLPKPVAHVPSASLFPLWKIELYLHDQKKKRDLWESLKRMPLSS